MHADQLSGPEFAEYIELKERVALLEARLDDMREASFTIPALSSSGASPYKVADVVSLFRRIRPAGNRAEWTNAELALDTIWDILDADLDLETRTTRNGETLTFTIPEAAPSTLRVGIAYEPALDLWHMSVPTSDAHGLTGWRTGWYRSGDGRPTTLVATTWMEML